MICYPSKTIYKIEYDEGMQYLVFRDDLSVVAMLDLSFCHNLTEIYLDAAEVSRDDSGKLLTDTSFFYLSPRLLVMSTEAYSKLESLLENGGYLIKVRTPFRMFAGFYCTVLADALDREKSECSWSNQSDHPLTIRKTVLKKSMIPRSNLFRLKSAPFLGIYCSEEFKQQVLNSKLDGLRFKEIELL